MQKLPPPPPTVVVEPSYGSQTSHDPRINKETQPFSQTNRGTQPFATRLPPGNKGIQEELLRKARTIDVRIPHQGLREVIQVNMDSSQRFPLDMNQSVSDYINLLNEESRGTDKKT